MLRLLYKLKVYFTALFTGSKGSRYEEGLEFNDSTASSYTIQRVERLKSKINHLDYKYTNNIADKQQAYHDKLFHYEKVLAEHEDAETKFNAMRITDTELDVAKGKVAAHELELRDAEKAVRTAEDFRKAELLDVLNEISRLEDSYTNDIAKGMTDTASQLTAAKKDYLKTVGKVSYGLRHVIETDDVMEKYSRILGISYDGKMEKLLSLKGEDLAGHVNDMGIDTEEISAALNGNVK